MVAKIAHGCAKIRHCRAAALRQPYKRGERVRVSPRQNCEVITPKGKLSNNRIWAHAPPLALLALAAAPHFVEFLSGI